MKYTIRFENHSTDAGDFCVYQTSPDMETYNVMSLAWFAKRCHPETEAAFSWEVAYNFVWSETGVLRPGVVFNASQSVNADLDSNNKITLNYDGAYAFKDQATADKTGTLFIKQDGSIPLKQAAVGVGMGDSPAYAVQAQPNRMLKFTPHPTYWVTFGTFTPGQVIDLENMTLCQQIDFPPNVYNMKATLRSDNTWIVAPCS